MDRRDFLRSGALAGGGALLGASLPACAPSSSRPARFESLSGLARGSVPPGPSDFEERRERARAAMRESGLEALAIEPGATLEYFSGVEWGRSERTFLLFLFLQGDPVWICPAFEERRARERVPADQEVRAWQEDESPFEHAAQALRSREVGKGPVGIEPTVRAFVAEGLRAALPGASVLLGAEAVRRCRMIKSERELSLLRRASEITKKCVAAAAPLATEGTTEAELAAAIREAHVAAGMRSPWALVLFGPNASFPHGTKEARRLREGDVVLADVGGALHGYQSDVTRTWVLGKPSHRITRAFEAVRRAQAASREAVRPGRPCGEIDGVARKVIEEAGFGDGYAAFTHRLGHGIGLEGHEEPYLVRGNGTLLAPGMTFSDEPGIYVPDEFGIRIEDILAVTADGAEMLGPPTPPLPEVPS